MSEDNKKSADVHKIDFGETKQKDVHLNKEVTRWIHHHRRLAKWLMRILVMGLAVASYYLKKEQKHIEEEDKKK